MQAAGAAQRGARGDFRIDVMGREQIKDILPVRLRWMLIVGKVVQSQFHSLHQSKFEIICLLAIICSLVQKRISHSIQQRTTDLSVSAAPWIRCCLVYTLWQMSLQNQHVSHFIWLYYHSQILKTLTCCFLVISFDITLAESKIVIALSSSKIFPSEDCNVSKILFSISFSCFLLAADWRIRRFLSSSNSGLKKHKSNISNYYNITSSPILTCVGTARSAGLHYNQHGFGAGCHLPQGLLYSMVNGNLPNKAAWIWTSEIAGANSRTKSRAYQAGG